MRLLTKRFPAMTRNITIIVFALFVSLASTLFADEEIQVVNFTDGTEIDYPVALLRGRLYDETAAEIVCTNLSSQKASRQIHGDAWKGQFKVLAELVPGENELELTSGDHKTTLKLNYKKNSNPLVVRMIYMTDSTGNTDFQTPYENDSQNFKGKLDTALKLMQCFTAETMNDAGLGRKTFNLELDENGDVVVHVFKGKLTAEEYGSGSDNEWYIKVYQEVTPQFPDHSGRNLVIPAYTRFDPEKKKPVCHTALGGGCQALFGSGCMYTWPDSLDGVVKAFTDSTPVDGNRFHDDSAFRSVYWAAASTTIGAALHELGHTFGLPHSNQPRDIMTRGIDQLNRFFVMREAPSRFNRNWLENIDNEAANWSPISAMALNVNPFFQDVPPVEKRGRVKLQLVDDNKTLELKAENGIAFFGVMSGGDRQLYVAPEPGQPLPKQMRFSVEELKDGCKEFKGDLELHAIDRYGKTEGIGFEIKE